ncbi:AraC family transcriptional regulator [Agarivorans sp. Toyoura001]|uniref:AraC family transcriptional regulator n=1 Tax=unclassified Agarivorans TaxID=2636026 RepID=UPI0010E78B4F|nr:AraC family transcriptional regulator [Agarivorans sp. Toyoura001]GDY26700.1 AraC family transcriptional regulator [Agarivorans sp. Toyoura001]
MNERHWQDKFDIGSACVERFLTTERFSELAKLQVNLAGVSYIRGEYFVSRRAPQEHSILISMAGVGSLHTPEGRQRLGPNEVVILPAGTDYSFSLASHFWRHNWFQFSADISWYRFPKKAKVMKINSSQNIDKCLKLLLDEEGKTKADPLVESALTQLLKRYLLQLLKPLKNQEPSPLHNLEQQLRSSLHYPWTVSEMAQRLSVSEAHCYRLFQQEFKCSPKQYLTRLRLEHGSYLLRESRWSIDVIASQLGYQDGFAFAHRFKKSFGVSPGRYRRQSQA